MAMPVDFAMSAAIRSRTATGPFETLAKSINPTCRFACRANTLTRFASVIGVSG